MTNNMQEYAITAAVAINNSVCDVAHCLALSFHSCYILYHRRSDCARVLCERLLRILPTAIHNHLTVTLPRRLVKSLHSHLPNLSFAGSALLIFFAVGK